MPFDITVCERQLEVCHCQLVETIHLLSNSYTDYFLYACSYEFFTWFYFVSDELVSLAQMKHLEQLKLNCAYSTQQL